MKKLLFVLPFVFLFPTIALGHPGNTDAYGCHTCRTNCTKWGLSYNEYHCHRSKGLEQPKEPVRSSATGVTVPAPEYKVPVVKTVKTTSAKTATTSTIIKTTSPQKSWLQTFFSKVL